jgi:hypothetical protein
VLLTEHEMHDGLLPGYEIKIDLVDIFVVHEDVLGATHRSTQPLLFMQTAGFHAGEPEESRYSVPPTGYLIESPHGKTMPRYEWEFCDTNRP